MKYLTSMLILLWVNFGLKEMKTNKRLWMHLRCPMILILIRSQFKMNKNADQALIDQAPDTKELLALKNKIKGMCLQKRGVIIIHSVICSLFQMILVSLVFIELYSNCSYY